MKVEQLNRSNDTIEFVIRLEPEDVRTGESRVYNRYRDYYRVPGFRKGRAPINVVKNFYGEEVFEEEVPEMLSEDMFDFAQKELKFIPVAPASTFEPYEDEDWAYRVVVSTNPPLDAIGEPDLEKYEIDAEISDDDVQEELNLQLHEYAPYHESGKVDEYSRVKLREISYRIGEDRTHILKRDVTDCDINELEDEARDEFLGKEKGFQTFRENGEFRNVLHLEEVSAPEPVELDDAFVKKVSTFENLDDYKDYLRQILLRDKISLQKIRFTGDILDEILETTEYELPEDFKARFEGVYEDSDFMILNILFKSMYAGEDVGTEEFLLKTLRNDLILDEVLVKEGLFVTEDDLNAVISLINLESQEMQSFISMAPKELVRVYLSYQAKRQKLAEHYFQKLLDNKDINLGEIFDAI